MIAARKSTISEWETFLGEFSDTLSDAAPRLLAISEPQSEIPRAEDKWSSKQIIGHLIDSAGNNHQNGFASSTSRKSPGAIWCSSGNFTISTSCTS